MLNGIRIDLIAYTASFRVPCFVGHQITLPVPPLSTNWRISATVLSDSARVKGRTSTFSPCCSSPASTWRLVI